jgi:distribution and morphology protein 34
MAFNFNWSPLVADTVRARDMLTNALNKSPKPPIIVDDIVVTELNLGTTPPDLEILEIGDLAQDRFRGIFKMSYAGDAFLTLKTRVQANPLNTYLSTRPAFASPQPLAAASGLTIPLQITLSDIKLSGFVILVFSRQKGLTLVFRNDPLESLKVSSTFDSIPFIRDYLQKQIEGQLRVLFMEDLPAILHKLSLRLWSPDYYDPSDSLLSKTDNTTPIDPLASPPLDPVDWLNAQFGDDSIPTLPLDIPAQPYTFSQKNLSILSSLGGSQHTLSLHTPAISHVVHRAWATSMDGRGSGIHSPTPAGLSRVNSAHSAHSPTASTYSVWSGPDSEPLPPHARPAFFSSSSSSSFSNHPRRPQRKRKHRVIDLRRARPAPSAEAAPAPPVPAVVVADHSAAPSVILDSIVEEPGAVAIAAAVLPESQQTYPDPSTPAKAAEAIENSGATPSSPEAPPPAYTPAAALDPLLRKRAALAAEKAAAVESLLRPSFSAERLAALRTGKGRSGAKSAEAAPPPPSSSSSTGGILERAWMMKVAREVRRRVEEERGMSGRGAKGFEAGARASSVADGLEGPPPAYVS